MNLGQVSALAICTQMKNAAGTYQGYIDLMPAPESLKTALRAVIVEIDRWHADLTARKPVTHA